MPHFMIIWRCFSHPKCAACPVLVCGMLRLTVRLTPFYCATCPVLCSGAIVPEDEGDFLTQLARDVLDGAKLPDLQTLFADDLQVSHNPMGSLTAPSATIVMGSIVLTWDEWVTQNAVFVKKMKRKEVVPEGQMGLGI